MTFSAEELSAAVAGVLVAGVLAAHPEAGAVVVGAAAALPLLAQKVGGFADRYAGQHDESLRLDRADATRAWLVGWTSQVPSVIAAQRRIEQRVDDFDARLEERIDDREFQRVIDNFGVEATREAIDERRRMLAHATAGAFNLSLTVAEAARAERVLREVDPQDIVLLRSLEAGAGLQGNAQGFDGLVAAGCAAIMWGGAGGLGQLRITDPGALVLALLRSYQPKG